MLYSSSSCGDPKHKLFLLPLHNCNFVTVMSYNINIWYEKISNDPCEKVFLTQRGHDPQVENYCSKKISSKYFQLFWSKHSLKNLTSFHFCLLVGLFFETWSHYIVLVGPEISVYQAGLNAQTPTCLCLLNAQIEDVCHHAWPQHIYF